MGAATSFDADAYRGQLRDKGHQVMSGRTFRTPLEPLDSILVIF
jgi:hypothetical protein